MSVFDFENAEVREASLGQLLEPGDYVVKIVEAKGGTVESSGNPMIELRLENDAGSIRDWLSITPKTVGQVATLYHVAKVAKPTAAEVDSSNGRLSDAAIVRLVGATVGVAVREEYSEMQQKTRNRVKGYFSPEKLTSDVPIDTRGLPQPSPSPSATPAAAGANSDEKIPF